jgi:enamine deaminase RidA (YjgF/YER057c/UK114 family)
MTSAVGLTPEQRVERLRIELPVAQKPLAEHLPVIIVGNLAFVSGHGPMDSNRDPIYVGPVGSRYTVEEGAAAARLSASNAIASLRAAIGSLDHVRQVVKLNGMVLSAPGFDRQPWVVDGASGLLLEVFGEERGPHARTSVGVGASALSLTITVELVFGLDAGWSG